MGEYSVNNIASLLIAPVDLGQGSSNSIKYGVEQHQLSVKTLSIGKPDHKRHYRKDQKCIVDLGRIKGCMQRFCRGFGMMEGQTPG